MCRSLANKKEINKLLAEIIEKEPYKADYLATTEKLLFKKVPYDEAVKVLEKISETGIF